MVNTLRVSHHADQRPKSDPQSLSRLQRALKIPDLRPGIALAKGACDLPVLEGHFVEPGVVVVLIFVSVHLEGYVDLFCA